MSGIVMGHDGSKNAQRALVEAATLASALGEPLTVLRAFGVRQGDWPEDVPFGSVPTSDELKVAAQRSLQQAVAPVRAEHPELAIEEVAVEGRPIPVLLERSAGARMVVVASKGQGGFERMLLGSTAERVVQHADCPVLVVRAPR